MRLVENLRAWEYHASPGVSASKLKWYGVSAAHGKAAEDGQIKIGKDVAEFGEAFHAATLEPATFGERYVSNPETYPAQETHAKVKKGKIKAGDPLPWNANAKVCEDWKLEQTRKIISPKEFRSFQAMSDRLQQDQVCGPYLRTKGRYELSIFGELDGVPVRARLDKLTDAGVILDLKSTRCAKPFDFIRQCIFLKYHVQAWWYATLLQEAGESFNGFVFAASEKEAPNLAVAYELDSAAFNKGREEGIRLFDLYKKCHREKRWPGYVDQAIPFQMAYPRWAIEMQDPSEQIIYELENA